MKNVGIISQARCLSTRLPYKIFLTSSNKPLIYYHTHRLSAAKLPLIVATTTDRSDDKVVDFCNKNNIHVFRGSMDNVLARFYHCALEYKLDTIIRVTSDCPLIDGEMIQDALSQYINYNDQRIYLSNCIERTFPRGFDFEIFSFDLLKEAFLNAKSRVEQEHVTPYIYDLKNNRSTIKHYKSDLDNSDYRLTVDTPDDFMLIDTLIEKFGCNNFGYHQIISVLKANPELINYNKHVTQKGT